MALNIDLLWRMHQYTQNTCAPILFILNKNDTFKVFVMRCAHDPCFKKNSLIFWNPGIWKAGISYWLLMPMKICIQVILLCIFAFDVTCTMQSNCVPLFPIPPHFDKDPQKLMRYLSVMVLFALTDASSPLNNLQVIIGQSLLILTLNHSAACHHFSLLKPPPIALSLPM